MSIKPINEKEKEKRELGLNRLDGEFTYYKAEYDTKKQIDTRKLLQLLKVLPITVSIQNKF